MNIAVRYYSKSGRTEQIAQAIAQGAGVAALSIETEPALERPCDLLFLGGAPYANVMAPELKTYADSLNAERVGIVVLFTTSNWSRRTVRGLRKLLEGKGISVAEEAFYANAFQIQQKKPDAEDFARRAVTQYAT